jgi:hypothetical protein
VTDKWSRELSPYVDLSSGLGPGFAEDNPSGGERRAWGALGQVFGVVFRHPTAINLTRDTGAGNSIAIALLGLLGAAVKGFFISLDRSARSRTTRLLLEARLVDRRRRNRCADAIDDSGFYAKTLQRRAFWRWGCDYQAARRTSAPPLTTASHPRRLDADLLRSASVTRPGWALVLHLCGGHRVSGLPW